MYLTAGWTIVVAMLTLKILRQMKGKSQWQLGVEAEVPNYKLSRIESGKLEPTKEELQRLASALQTTPEVLRKEISEEALVGA